MWEAGPCNCPLGWPWSAAGGSAGESAHYLLRWQMSCQSHAYALGMARPHHHQAPDGANAMYRPTPVSAVVRTAKTAGRGAGRYGTASIICCAGG